MSNINAAEWLAIVPAQNELPVLDAPVGFDALLKEVAGRLHSPLPLEAALEICLSMGGRQSSAFGRAALSEREQRIALGFASAVLVPSVQASQRYSDSGVIHVFFHECGRLILSNTPPPLGVIALGCVTLNDAQRRQIEALESTVALEQSIHRAELVKKFRQLDVETRLQWIHVVRQGIDHIDPVIIYTHDRTYSNYSKFNNLLGRNYQPQPGTLLDDLATDPYGPFNDDDIEFLYCFYQLKRAGFRGEEFGGQQLTVSTLRSYLADKAMDLAHCLGRSEPKKSDAVASAETEIDWLVEECAGMKRALRKTHFVYRQVNGLCFNKTEHYSERGALSLSVDRLPSCLHNILQEFGVYPRASRYSLDELFRQAVDYACESEDVSLRNLNMLERLLTAVVESACLELRSGIGMSRGLRSVGSWANAFAENTAESLIDAPTSDYFCAVVVSPGVHRQLNVKPGLLAKTLTAIANRMTFNSWHYMPGYFTQSHPRSRHFYFPPRMADTATWSDQHHAGHVFANVRYSIRSPGGLMVCGRKYHGLFDLRLMRSRGEPYSLADLMRAREYTAYLRAIYQAVIDRHMSGLRTPRISAFNKEWYAQQFK